MISNALRAHVGEVGSEPCGIGRRRGVLLGGGFGRFDLGGFAGVLRVDRGGVLNVGLTFDGDDRRLFSLGARLLHQVAVADDNRGVEQREDRDAKEELRELARAAPFMKRKTPAGAEDDNGRHVQGPAGELVFAHARFAHRIEEELEVPSRSGDRGEEIVPRHVDLGLDGLAVDGRDVRIVDFFIEELIRGAVP